MRGKAILGVMALGGAVLLYRRVGFRARERAELQFDDGSTVSLAGSPEVGELAAIARQALAAARG